MAEGCGCGIAAKGEAKVGNGRYTRLAEFESCLVLTCNGKKRRKHCSDLRRDIFENVIIPTFTSHASKAGSTQQVTLIASHLDGGECIHLCLNKQLTLDFASKLIYFISFISSHGRKFKEG